MKKFFVILAFLLLLLIVALSVFIITFDADRYRPMLISQIENATGLPVEISKISLGWHNGPALAMKGLKVYSGEDRRTVILGVDHAAANVNPSPLLHGQVVISAFVVKEPQIHLIRSADGTLKGFQRPVSQVPPSETQPPAGSVPSGEAKAAGAAAFVLSFDTIQVDDAIVSYQDLALGMTQPVALEDIDLTLSDVSLHQPIKVDGKASLFSAGQNVEIQSIVKFDLGTRSLVIQHPVLTVKLDQIERERLARSLDFMKNLSLPEKVGGTLKAEAPEIRITDGRPDYQIQVTLSNGLFRPQDFPSTVKNIEASASLTPSRVELQNTSLNFADGKGGLSGVMNLGPVQPGVEFRASLVGMDLSQVASQASPQAPYPTGRLTVTFEGRAAGIDTLALSQTLNGGGQIMLANGVIHNFNLVHEVLGRLSAVPGLGAKLEQRLPPDYKAKIDDPDTRLAPVQAPFTVRGPEWFVPQLNIVSETFSFTGSIHGNWTNNTYRGQFSLFLDPDLSQALIRSVEELSFLSNAEGRIEIPVALQESPPYVIPNVSNMATRVVSGKAQQLISNLFDQKDRTQGQQAGAPAGAGTAQPPQQQQASGGREFFPFTPSGSANQNPSSKQPPPAQMLLGQLLNDVLGSSGQQQDTGGNSSR